MLIKSADYFLSSCLCMYIYIYITRQIDPASAERQLKEEAAAPQSPFSRKMRWMIARRSSPFICFPSRVPPPQHLLLPHPLLLPPPAVRSCCFGSHRYRVRRAQCARNMCYENSLRTVWEQFGNSLGIVLGNARPGTGLCIQMKFKWGNASYIGVLLGVLK